MSSPPSSPAVAAATLRRSASDRVLLGVCAGVAAALGLSAVWVRLAAVALLVTVPPLALVAYAVAGVVVPRDDGRMALAGSPPDTHESVAAWGVTALAAVVALSRGGLLLDLTDPVVLLLAAGAVAAALILSRRGDAPSHAGGAAPAAPAATPAAGTQDDPTVVMPTAHDGEPTLMTSATDDPTVVMPPEQDDPTVVMPTADDPTVVMPPAQGDPTVVMPPAPDDPTVVLPPGGPGAAAPEAAHAVATRRGPSLLLLGLGVLAFAALAVVVGNPMATLALTATQTVHMGAGVFGILAVLGIVAAIALWDRRHAVGLMVLSLAVGAMALGLAAMPEPTTITDSGSLTREVIDRVADLLRLN